MYKQRYLDKIDFIAHFLRKFSLTMLTRQGKGQKISKANHGFLNSPKKRTKLTILSKKDPQDSEFFERIEDTINCFRDLLTFRSGTGIVYFPL